MNMTRITSCARSMADSLFSILAAPRCRLCRAPLFGHVNPFFCPACASRVEWIGKGACRGCGYPSGPHASHDGECQRCRGRRLRLTAAAAVARYRSGARELVLGLKFRRETELARPIAGLMAERMRGAAFPPIDLVLPVSLHPERRRTRGFDQAQLLARHIAGATGLKTASGLVERTRHTTPQAALRREARLLNMEGAFRASPELSGKSVLLVDDVMTTGATMAECAKACREAGARRVSALVFAR